jgi:hypothetical protein
MDLIVVLGTFRVPVPRVVLCSLLCPHFSSSDISPSLEEAVTANELLDSSADVSASQEDDLITEKLMDNLLEEIINEDQVCISSTEISS